VKINTKPFGEIEIDERQIIDFSDGILGFDFIKKFALIDFEDKDSLFKWLQAVGESELAFIVIRPEDFIQSYKLSVSEADLFSVKIDDASKLLVLAIVTIPENPAEMSANLQGPIIVNYELRLGKQAISLSDKYSVRQKILDEIKKTGKSGE